MWHVSSRSGVATLRTAIHLLLAYLLSYLHTTLNVYVSKKIPAIFALTRAHIVLFTVARSVCFITQLAPLTTKRDVTNTSAVSFLFMAAKTSAFL